MCTCVPDHHTPHKHEEEEEKKRVALQTIRDAEALQSRLKAEAAAAAEEAERWQVVHDEAHAASMREGGQHPFVEPEKVQADQEVSGGGSFSQPHPQPHPNPTQPSPLRPLPAPRAATCPRGDWRCAPPRAHPRPGALVGRPEGAMVAPLGWWLGLPPRVTAWWLPLRPGPCEDARSVEHGGGRMRTRGAWSTGVARPHEDARSVGHGGGAGRVRTRGAWSTGVAV